MSCGDWEPNIDTQCTEMQPLIKTVRVYRRFPRKMKKKIRRLERIERARLIVGLVNKLVYTMFNTLYGSPGRQSVLEATK